MLKESLHIYILDSNGNKTLFPSAQNPAVLSDWSYTAERMGNAPNITATLMYGSCLDSVWKREEFVEYKGERYYVKQVPSSSKDNTDARYKHDITFVSRREILEDVFWLNVVTPYTELQYKDRERSNNTTFKFMGDIHEYVACLNDSLIYSGLYDKETESGYKVVIDDGITSETKLVDIKDAYINDALKEINNIYGLPHYWVGQTCHIGYAENEISVPLEYGKDNALLSIEKTNENKAIINRVTGIGGTDNIPFYYPNRDEYGEAVFETAAIDKAFVDVALSKIMSYNPSGVYTTYFYGERNIKDYKGNSGPFHILNICDGFFADDWGNVENYQGDFTQYEFSFEAGSYSASVYFAIQGHKGDVLSFKRISTGGQVLFLQCHPVVPGDGYKTEHLLEEIFIAPSDNNPVEKGDVNGLEYERVSSGGDTEYRLYKDGWFVIKITHKIRVNYKGTAHLEVTGDIEYNVKLNAAYYRYDLPNNEMREVSAADSGITLSPEVSASGKGETSNYILNSDGSWTINHVPAPSTSFSVSITGRKYITPSPNLMPSIYRDSWGEEIFYNAENDKYDKPDGSGKYTFVNVFEPDKISEGKFEHTDIIPTINGIRNSAGELFGTIADIAFDELDSDKAGPNNNNEYVHSYFYIRLNIFSGDWGFNLFEHAIENEAAKIEMTSGDCAACEFEIVVEKEVSEGGNSYVFHNPVVTDGSGNLKKVSDVEAGGYLGDYIAPIERKEEWSEEQQDTETASVWIAVKKESITNGQVRPNKAGNIKPKIGDKFVITGIKLPQPYILAAEKRLVEVLIKEMKENNEEKFSFAIKFSRIYLAEHSAFTALLNENVRLSVKYDNIIHSLYVSSYTCKADGNILHEVSVTVVDEFTSTQSSINKQLTSISSQIADFQNQVTNTQPVQKVSFPILKSEDNETTPTESNVNSAARSEKRYHRKDKTDSTPFLQIFDGGIRIGGSTIDWDDTNKALRIDTDVYSEKGVSALGMSPGGTGGGTGGSAYDRYDGPWGTAPTDGSVLSAALGVDLNTRLSAVENGKKGHVISVSGTGNVITGVSESADGTTLTFTKGTIDLSGYATLAALNAHTGDTTIHITAAERTKWNKVVADFAAITGTDSDTIINKWEEVVAFLDTYTEADTLAGLLGNKADKTVKISAGTGLTGGGDLSANRTLSLAASGVTAGTYTKVTVDAYGRVTTGTTLSANDIPALSISKITGLQSELDKKLNKTDFASYFATEIEKWFVRDLVNKGIYPADYDGEAVGLYSKTYVSTLGVGGTGGGGGTGGASALYELIDVLANSTGDGVQGAAAGSLLSYDGTHWKAVAQSSIVPDLTGYATESWVTGQGFATVSAMNAALAGKVDKVAGKGLSTNDFTTALLNKLNGIEAGANKYVLPTASASVLGGIKVGSRLAIDANGVLSATYTYTLPTASATVKGGVKVGDTLAIASEVLNLKSGIVTTGTYTKVTVDTYGRVTAGAVLAATDIPALDWSKITTGKPTTLAGYGITDAYTKTQADGRYLLLTGGTVTGKLTVNDAVNFKSTVAIGGDTTTWGKITVGGNVNPSANDTYQLGTSALRWHNVLTNYLNASGPATLASTLSVDGAATLNSTLDVTDTARFHQGIELYFTTPYIDFHFNNSTVDYTSRIIEQASGVLTMLANVAIPSSKVLKIGNCTISWDATNNALKFDKDIYSEKGVSALGLSNTGSSGGGTSYDRLDAWTDYTSDKSEYVLSAGLGYGLYTSLNSAVSRISSLEGGAAVSVTTTGSGNAITAISKSGTTITATKGATFLTSHQALDHINFLGTVPTSPISGTNKFATGLRLYGVYNNGYPCSYGNLLRIGGSGQGELIAQWTHDKSVGRLYYRSIRENSDAWTDWRTVAYTSDMSISGGVITINGTSITPLTAHQAVSNKAATLAWNTAVTVATVGSTNITVKLPANPNTDTKNTAGSTDTSSKIFLIGATSQAASPQTYSHDTAFVGTDGCLYSGGSKVLTAHQSLANYVTLNTAQTITGQKTFGAGLLFSDLTGTNTRNLLYQKIADNDYFRLLVGGTATNAGYVELATADDGNEPIYVRQYAGVFSTLAHSITLMDGSGNQTFNTVTAAALKKSGGTSSQFLKADGSVDGNSYLTTGTASSTYVKKSGDTMTGTLFLGSNGQVFSDSTYGTWLKYGSNYINIKDGNPLVNNTHKIWHAGNDGAGSGLDADLLDGVHASGLFTGLSLSNSQLTATIGGVSKTVETVMSKRSGGYSSMNAVAALGNCMGMTSLEGTSTLVNPNAQTSWHHFINLSYNYESTNMWQTQFAIKAGTTQVWVRSRAGGTISDTAAWVAPWVQLARVTDNVATATKLQTARTINGTSFDGTANITTANWGTARTLTIGSTGKSVNGSGNVAWSLAEIGALPTAGGLMTGNIRYNAKGESYIGNGPNDATNGVGGALNNLVISSWYGISFTTSCSGQTYTGTNAVSINCRTGNVYAARFNGPLTGAVTGNATSATQLQNTRTIWGQSFNGTANVSGLLTATTGSNHSGIKLGTAYMTAIGNQVIFQNLSAIRFGTSDSWNLDVWAGIRYDSANKHLYMGFPTGSPFNYNTAASTGQMTLSGVTRLNVTSGGVQTKYLFINTGDATLKVYDGRITDAKSDGNICLQTSIDATDGQTHANPTQYSSRCNLVLQPRGGQVYIGQNPDGGSAYKLNVNGDIHANGWLRTTGNYGWYSQSYGGGWYMNETTWIRNWGNKSLYMNTATIRTDGDLQVGNGGEKFHVTNAGIVTALGEIKSKSANAFRLAYGNYGVILRNDGTNFYALLTASGSALSGSWNSLRPLTIGLATGRVMMDNGAQITGTLEANCNIIMPTGRTIRIGDGVLEWDSANSAFKVSKYGGGTANFYATGGVSALGLTPAGTGSASVATLNVTDVNIGGDLCFDNMSMWHTPEYGGCIHIASPNCYFDIDGWLYNDAVDTDILYVGERSGNATITIYYNDATYELDIEKLISNGYLK